MEKYLMSRKYVLIFFVFALFSCDREIAGDPETYPLPSTATCTFQFDLNKKFYLSKDPFLKKIASKIDSIDVIINTQKVRKVQNNKTKFGDFTVISQNKNKLKFINEIYLKDLKLAATKHEIYFIDECTIISKMTKYGYSSKRIKSIFYFLFFNNEYKGCIMHDYHTMFHKKDRWLNISDDAVTIDWSRRIYHNMIKPHFY